MKWLEAFVEVVGHPALRGVVQLLVLGVLLLVSLAPAEVARLLALCKLFGS